MNSRSKISGPRRSDSVLDGSTVRNLSSIDPGEGGTVVRIDDRIKSQIAAMGVRVGCHLVLDNRQPFNGPVVVKVGNIVTSIGRKMAEGIEVAVER